MEFKIISIKVGGRTFEHLSAIKFCERGPPRLHGKMLTAPLPRDLEPADIEFIEKILEAGWSGDYFNAIDVDDWRKAND